MGDMQRKKIKGTGLSNEERRKKSSVQVQEVATRQDKLTSLQDDINKIQNNISKIQNSMSSSINAGRLPQFDKMSKIGRRCSLGFVRGMGRRGSLLFDGDEVLFGDKKFHFTTGYN